MIADLYISAARGFQVLGVMAATWALCGLAVLLWREFRRAPDGQEDRSGFHSNDSTR